MESNYFITENQSGVCIRLKKNNRVIKRIVCVPREITDKELEEFANTGIASAYPYTMEECYSTARCIISELDKIDSFRQLPQVKLLRSVGVSVQHRSLVEY